MPQADRRLDENPINRAHDFHTVAGGLVRRSGPERPNARNPDIIAPVRSVYGFAGHRRADSLVRVMTGLQAENEAGRFATTRWDLVLASAETHAPGADEALSDLCRTYWRPLYAFVRRRGYSPTDAEDLVQDFFAQFLRERGVKKADRQRGRFRTFLLSSLQNFLANEWDRASAAKRGGKFSFVGFDQLTLAERAALDAPDAASPEMAFDTRWASAIVETALQGLRAEAAARGKTEVFEELKEFLTTAEAASYTAAASRLGMPLNAVKTAIHRLRGNFRVMVRREVARTVSSPVEIEDELRYLRSVLASSEGAALSSV